MTPVRRRATRAVGPLRGGSQTTTWPRRGAATRHRYAVPVQSLFMKPRKLFVCDVALLCVYNILRYLARLVTAQCALDCSLLEWRFGRRARARRRGESARSARRHAIKMKIKMKGAADQNENKNEVTGYRFSICAANSDRLSTSTRVGVARSHDSGGLRLSEYCSVRCVSLSQTP